MSDAGDISVSLTVCPNGMGHAVRALRVMRELVGLRRGFRLTAVTLTPSQQGGLRAETRAWLGAHGTRILEGISDPGVALEQDPSAYGDGRLRDWEDRWAATPALAEADLVVSDNLVGVLTHRPDAVLMGSFLWSDVLEAMPGPSGDAPAEIDAFVLHERDLLARHVPPMLCTADVASDGVLRRTTPVPLPWFDDRRWGAEDAEAPVPASRRVAIVGGSTGAQAQSLAVVAARLDDAGWETVSHLPGPEEPPVSAVICRPGIGTVTECVMRALPMVLVRESWNPELTHTTAALVGLGLAVDLGSDDPDAVLRRIVDSETGRSMARMLRGRPAGGHRAAAAWLADRMSLTDRAEGGPRR